MAKNLEATMVGLSGVKFRQAKGTDIIEVTLTDEQGDDFRHSLWMDGQGGPDKAIETVKLSLQAYGWDGEDLASLVEPEGRVKHISFPDEGVPVVYRVNEFTDNKGTMHTVCQIRYIKGIGGGELDKAAIKKIEQKLKGFSTAFNKDEELI